jgi:hypothetical protein
MKAIARPALFIAFALLWAPWRAHATVPPPFVYSGGTESVPYDCGGQLDVSPTAMTFRCSAASITIPYRTITHMEYRPKLSSAVRKMKLRWKIKPSGSGRNKNLFFTVLFTKDHHTHAVVFRVRPDEMRPYLALLELDTGKRIQVWDYRGFD